MTLQHRSEPVAQSTDVIIAFNKKYDELNNISYLMTVSVVGMSHFTTKRNNSVDNALIVSRNN